MEVGPRTEERKKKCVNIFDLKKRSFIPLSKKREKKLDIKVVCKPCKGTLRVGFTSRISGHLVPV